MKVIMLSTIILLYFSQAAFPANGLELLVTCDQGKEAGKAAKLILDENGYTPDGLYFYRPVKDQEAFGATVLYAGIAGVDLLPGPNVSVSGDYKEILEKVEEVYSGQFECGQGVCVSMINDDLFVAVYKHVKKNNVTIVQCGMPGQK